MHHALIIVSRVVAGLVGALAFYLAFVGVRREGPVTLGEWKRQGEFFEFRDEQFDLWRGAPEGRELVRPKGYITILA